MSGIIIMKIWNLYLVI